jgi:hypothetical protein
LWPAIFGLMLWRHLGVLSDDDPVRQAIVLELLSLAEGPDPSVTQEKSEHGDRRDDRVEPDRASSPAPG